VNWINPNSVVDGPDLAIRVVVDDGPFDAVDATVTIIIDPDTGSMIQHISGDSLQLSDGRFVVAQRSLGAEERQVGPLVLLDRASNSTTELDGCVAVLEDLLAGAEIDCPGPFFSWYAFDHGHLVSSFDGSYFAATSYAPSESPRTVRVWDSSDLEVRNEFSVPFFQEAFAAGPSWIATISDPDVSDTNIVTVYDVDTGTIIAELDGPAPEAFGHTVNAVTNDGSILLVGDVDGLLLGFDTSSWEQVTKWRAHDALLRGLAVSPDGARLATTGQDDLVKIWDISGLIDGGSFAGPPPLLDRIPAEFPSDAAWLSSDRLAVFLAEGVEYLDVSLNVDDLVAEATQRLTRSFSVEECAVYQIDACPTLEQIRSR
jgi:WD40 repeat protein